MTALEVGYRHVDTARAYRREPHVRAVVQRTGLAGDVFVATKLGLAGEVAELRTVAARHGPTPFDVSLAWLHSRPNVATLSHPGDPSHMASNPAATRRVLDEEQDHWLVAASPLIRGFVAEIREVREVAAAHALGNPDAPAIDAIDREWRLHPWFGT